MISLDLSYVEGAATLWFVVAAFVVAVGAYFLGCINGAVIVSKYILRDDVRTHGSGNAGLTNFHRTFGGKLTLVVLLCDVVKAVLAVFLGMLAIRILAEPLAADGFLPFLSKEPALLRALGKYWAGLFCLLGHMFPCMFRFKGGKGILSGGTMAIMIDWRVALVVWGGFLLLAGLTRYVSLGSSSTGITFPIISWIVYRDWVILALAVLIGGLILWKHRGNLIRLAKGTESKFSLHHKEEGKKE